MRKLNFLSKSSGKSHGLQSSDLGFDRRSTVVRPSFDRRSNLLKLLSVLVLVLTFGVGQMWGADDVINNSATSSKLGNTATSAWVNAFTWEGASGANYTIRSMGTKSTTQALQWNTSGYLYQTSSGGTLKSVTINGKSGKSVKIYASNSAYNAQPSGTALATLNLTGSDATYTFTSNYTYLALVGGASGVAITSITVEYTSGGSTSTALSVPTGMSSGTPGMTSATLTWNTVANADGYALTIGTNDPITSGFTTNNNTVSYTLSGLESETTYTWKVKATTTDTEHYSNSADCAAQEFETAADPTLLKVVYDFTKTGNYPSGFPTSSGTTLTNPTSFTFGSNSLILYSPSNYYRANYSSTYSLFFGQTANSDNKPSGAYIEFPARSGYKLTKVVVHENSQAGNGANLNIWSTDGTAMSTAIASDNIKDKDGTFVLNQSAYNTAYRLTAATQAGKNLRFDKITLTYAPKPTVSSIAIKTAPTKTTYTANETFDPSGLVITVNYEGGSSEDVTYSNVNASDFSFTPTTSTALNATHTSVTVTYADKTANQAITVNRIATTLAWTVPSYTTKVDNVSPTYPTLIKTPNDLTGVTYSSSDEDVAVIDENTGEIVLGDPGTTTITAAFAQTDVYAAATSATYTLIVNAASSPSLEADPTALDFPLTAVGGSSELTFDLYGEHLTANASLAISGANANMFSVVANVDKDASDEIAETITVTYAPTAAAVSHAATLTITSGVASATVSLSGSAKVKRTVTWYKADDTELTAQERGSATTEVWNGDAVTAMPSAPGSCDPAISFQGWTNATYAKSDDAPAVLFTDVEHAPAVSGGNASYYAVWAQATTGDYETTNIAYTGGSTTTMTADANGAATFGLNTSQWSVVSHENSANTVGLNKDGTIRLYNNTTTSGHTSLAITAPETIISVELTLVAGKNNAIIKVEGEPVEISDGEYPINATSFEIFNGYDDGTQLQIKNIAVNFAGAPVYKNYSTTCYAPVVIADPTFSPAAGSYNEDQNVTITAEDGMTIYYSIGAESNPKTSGTAYTGAISVTEDKVIKAIATDGDGNWSGIVTKTYEINYSSSIAAFIAKAQNTPRALKLNAAQNCIITGIREYEASNTTKYDLYIQDINSGIIAYGLTAVPEGAAEGKRIEGTISGTYSIAAGQHRITGADFTNATFNNAAALTPTDITAVDETAYEANPMMLVKLSGVYYNTGSYYFTSQAEGQGTSNYVYDNFKKFNGKTMPANTVVCDITGVIVKYISGNTTTYELFPYNLTTEAVAALPTISPAGGVDAENAEEVTYLSTVSVSLVENEDIYVSINDAEATKLTEAASIQIENDTKIAITAKRDFYADNSVTYYYKSSAYPKNIDVTSANGEVVVKVGGNVVSTALPGATVTFTVTPENEHFHITSTSVTYEGGSLTPSLSENVYSFMMPDKDATIVVNYSEDAKYSISFAKNGASGDDPTGYGSQYYAGTPITLPICPYTYDEMKFTGWVVTYGENISVPQSEGGFSMPAGDVTITAQWVAKQYCALTLRVNGQDQTPFYVERLVDYDLTSHNPSVEGYTFYGWAELNEDVEDDVAVAPTILTNNIFTPGGNEETKKLYAVFKHSESVDTKDVLTASDLAATGSGYVDFSNVSKTSDAVYAGNSALDGEVNIQLRSKNSNSGIVSTTSGGTIKSVKITVAKGSNTVDVYGSNSAYTDATILYGNSKGTQIGSITETGTITPTAQQVFEHVGIRSHDGAIYLSSVEITWTNSTYTYTTIPATLYDVTYNLDGGAWSGDGCPDTQVKDGMGYSICAEDPVRDGYKFVEWQVGGVAKSGEITISGTTEIVAIWTPKAKSALTYAPGEGAGTQQTISNVEEGTVITLPSIGTGEGQIDFSKVGYKFVGWNNGTETYASGASFTMPDEAVTLTAQWEEGSDFSWIAKDRGYTNGTAVTTATTELEPIVITYAKGDGSTAPTFYGNSTAGEVRMYKDNTVTIATASASQLIKSIVFTFGSESNNSLSGNGLSVDGTTGTWSGLAKTLTFINNTEGTAKAYVEAITVTYANGTVTTLQIANIALKTSDENATAIVPVCNVDPTPTITYSGYDEDLITIENGTVAHKGIIGNTTVTATIDQGGNYLAATTTFTVTVTEKTQPTMSFPEDSYNANLGSDFAEPTLTTVPDGLTVKYGSSVETVATVNENTGEIELVGEGQTVITASFAGNDDYSAQSASYTLNVIDPYKDVLTAALIGKTSYEAWSNKTFGSGVKYAGYNTTGGGDKAGSIQMNANPGGIVTTSAIGYLKSLSATAHTGNTKALEIYAKGTAYESSADLYSSDEAVKGVKIGTIGANGGAMVFETGKAYSDNYKFIGIKPVGGAVYYDNITITWTPAEFASFAVTYKAGEASGEDVVENIEEGTIISLKAANTFTAPEGKMFAGWLLEGEENVREAGSKFTVTEDATFTAQWVSVYTITYVAGEGTGDDVVVENVPVGNYELAANTFTAPESKEFAGWKLNNEGETLAAGSNYNVSGNASFTAQWSIVKQAADLAYATTSYIITRGREFAAPELTNPHSLTVTYSGNNDEVATVNANTGELTLKGVVGEVTVTASSAETDYYFAGEASYTLKVMDASLAGGWERLTSASTLVNGMKVIVAEYVASGNDINAMGEQKANNRGQVAGTLEDNKLVADEGTAIFTLVKVGENTFAFKAADKKYLYAASSSQNYLKSQTKIDGNATWTIVLSEGGKATITAQGNYTHNVMRYNKNSSLFSCYTGNQQDIALYSKTIAVSEGETNASTLEEYADVVVAEGATLVIDNAAANKPLGNITGSVEVNAPLQAEGVQLGVKDRMTVNSTVNVPSFSISVKLGSTGQATNVTVDVEHGARIAAPEGYVDMELADGANPDHWHSFTVPFEVDALNGIYDAETGAPLQNEVNYAIMDYHGKVRANGNYGWKKYRGTLQPGTFYLLTIDGNSKVLRFMKKAGSSYVAGNSMEMKYYGNDETEHGYSGASTDFGWCGVGNQNMFDGYVPSQYVAQVLNATGDGYEDIDNADALSACIPFFIQVNVTVNLVMNTSAPSQGLAPRRMPAKSVERMKVFFGNEKYTDKLYISASEEALNQYEIGKDLVKMTMTNTPNVAQIFGNAYGDKLCVVNAPMANDKASYDLTLYAPEAGEYTISAPATAEADIYLTKNGMIIWNLSMNECTLTLEKGNNEGFGLLLVKKAPEISTGVESTEFSDQNSAVQKVIIDEHVYILREGQMYDVTGKMVK